jgi:hypothetical protein
MHICEIELQDMESKLIVHYNKGTDFRPLIEFALRMYGKPTEGRRYEFRLIQDGQIIPGNQAEQIMSFFINHYAD